MDAAEPLALNAAMGSALAELRTLCAALEAQGQTGNLKLDLSLVNDMEYYNGLVFQGYLAGSPRAVLRGGQYDPLAEQFRPGARGPSATASTSASWTVPSSRRTAGR